MMIQPAYRLLLMFDVHPNRYESYYRFMLGEFVPTMQELGLYMLSAWQVHGEYPERQVEFVCETRETLRDTLGSDTFQKAEKRLKTYTTSYTRKVVAFEDRFQM